MPTHFIDLGNFSNTITPIPPDDDYIITGADGNNTVTLGNGTDQITLGHGGNTLTVGDGPDTIMVGDGNNTVTTGNGNSSVTVGNGNDTITVGTGSNAIGLGTGLDTVHTEAGDNTVSVSAGAVSGDTIMGALTSGDGSTNRLVLTTAGIMSPVNVSGFGSYRLADGGPNTLTLAETNFARLPGGTITVFGGNSGNTVNAAVLSAAHAVTVHGGGGLDALTGGAGNDLFIFNPSDLTGDTADGGGGSNTLELAAGSGTGTLSGLGTSFINLGTVLVDANATWIFSALNPSVTETINIGSRALAEIQGAVGAGQTVAFAASYGTLKLGAPSQFAGTITGFQLGDTVDLANVVATGLQFANGILTATNGGATVATLAFSGNLAGSNFRLTTDGQGGTDIGFTTPAGDFNADGRSDLSFQTPDNRFLVSQSTGSGFAPVQQWAAEGGPGFMSGQAQYADVNGDGRDDLIYQGTDNQFWLALSNGTSFVQTGGPAAAQGGPGFIAGQAQYADVNGDGKADLIYQGTDNQFWLALSNGTGFTQTAGPAAAAQGGAFVAGQAQYADVNGDGKADLMYQDLDNRFFLSLSTGTGFDPGRQVLQHGGSFVASEAQYADFNGDGKADLMYQGLDNRLWESHSTGNVFSAPELVLDLGGTFQAGSLHV